MAEDEKREETYQALFVQLVLSLHSAVMQHLGKLPNPLTSKIERNLDQARMSIDMLDMLKEKTRGNLSDEESRLIQRLVSECKLNFVDELVKEEKEKKAREEKEKEEAAATTAGTTAAEGAPEQAAAEVHSNTESDKETEKAEKAKEQAAASANASQRESSVKGEKEETQQEKQSKES